MAEDPLKHIPACTITPSLRCYHQIDGPPARVCGALAAWERPTDRRFVTEFFCDAHRLPSDAPVAAVTAFRRVHLTLEVFLAGAAAESDAALNEAVARIQLAMQAIGGIAEVQRAISQLVKNLPSPARREAIGPWARQG